MSYYLFTTMASDDLGLLTRSLPVARELARRGHRVAFCNPAAAPRRLIADAGLPNLPLHHPAHRINDLRASGELNLHGLARLSTEFGGPLAFTQQFLHAIPTRLASPTAQIWNVDHMMAMTGMLSENFVRAEYQAMRSLFEQEKPDVIVDAWNPAACLAARVMRKPLASLLQADVHPASRGFIWWKETPPALPGVTVIYNKILAESGFAPLRKIEELLVGDLTLVMGLPETDPLPASANVHYIGAILWQNGAAQLPAWINNLPGDQPLVWVYPGNPRYLPVPSPLDGEGIIRVCIEALGGEKLQVVLSSGHHPLPKKFLPLPKNFTHADYLPGLAMAERCDLMIHHGGYGSCQTGLYTGTPAVIIPTFSERESNARRVAAAGAAEFALPGGNPFGALWGKWGADPVEVREKTWRVLNTSSYQENARRVSQKLKASGGSSAAADLIEQMMSTSALI